MNNRFLKKVLLPMVVVVATVPVPVRSMDWGFSRVMSKEQLKDAGANGTLAALACGALLVPCCPKATVCGGALAAGTAVACGTRVCGCSGAHHSLRTFCQAGKDQLKEMGENSATAAFLCGMLMLPCCPKVTVCYGALAAGAATGCGTRAYQLTPAYRARHRVNAFFERLADEQVVGAMNRSQLAERSGQLADIHEELLDTEDLIFCLPGHRREFREKRALCKQMLGEIKARQTQMRQAQRDAESSALMQ